MSDPNHLGPGPSHRWALAQMAASALLLLLVLPAGAWPGPGLPCWLCMHCSCPPWPPATPSPHVRMSDGDEWVGLPHVGPTIDISILKGEKGKAGVRGRSSSSRKEGLPGSQGLQGLHSIDALQAVPFDMELVNLDGAFDLASGRFLCAVPGVYFLSLNVHTWNYKETYLHIMCNRRAAAVLDGDNAIYSERGDLYITFSGHLVKPDAEL
ncbi:hypothetical protein E2I00_007303 [Balaenoptera physalus]|uniref:C1q domain-containing protein n=1 Tax=Balaenoptera physalus TaxID=9770 RepID=A0A6A1Q2J6_BALPH|nr:hypothetical protein E2I00_007303 [Balaenoptera physalus]